MREKPEYGASVSQEISYFKIANRTIMKKDGQMLK
jgi:hypothetical protein